MCHLKMKTTLTLCQHPFHWLWCTLKGTSVKKKRFGVKIYFMLAFNISIDSESIFPYIVQTRSVCFWLKISGTPPYCFMGISDVTALFAEEFSATPYSFEPEYEEEEKSNSSQSFEEISCGSNKEVYGRLLNLEWCKCLYCATATLSHPRECLCCLKHQR